MTPPSDDADDFRARPIRQRPGQPRDPRRRPTPSGDDEVYRVDTRGRTRPPGAARQRNAPRSTPPVEHEAPLQSTRPMPRVRPPQDRPRPVRAAQGGGNPPRGRGPQTGRPTGPPRSGGRPASAPSRRHRTRRWMALLGIALVAYAVWLAWVPIHAFNAITKVDSTPTGQRPAAGEGSNFLLVGSDSRTGLSEEQKKKLAASNAGGERTDSIILVHKSSSGKSSMVSIPRDSYVKIPGHGSNKINAAFAFGGPKLLVETVEQATGLRIDGYLEIGFGGFANVVDAVGGVTMCAPFDMNDPQAGINLKKGCQVMNGPTALGFVRARYSDPRGDIGRAERQRQFLAAIVKKTATPGTVLWPPKYYSTSMAVASGLTVGEDTSKWEVMQTLLTMRSMSQGNGVSMVVPIATESLVTNAGLSIKWDSPKATALFDALKNDTAIDAPLPGTDGVPTGGQ